MTSPDPNSEKHQASGERPEAGHKQAHKADL